MKIELENILIKLSQRRPIFHSEADFQHELAHEIRCAHPDFRYRLEMPRPKKVDATKPEARGAIDIAVYDGSGGPCLFLELKYKTRRCNESFENEDFNLAGHGASSWGQYDVIKDIRHIENLKKLYPSADCAVVALTNDRNYWETVPGANSAYRDFSLHDGANLSGIREWRPQGTDAQIAEIMGRQRARSGALGLSGTYNVQWQQYSERLGLRYLILEAAPTVG